MNAIDYAVLAVLAVLILLAGRYLWKRRGRCGGCHGCQGCSACYKEQCPNRRRAEDSEKE